MCSESGGSEDEVHHLGSRYSEIETYLQKGGVLIHLKDLNELVRALSVLHGGLPLLDGKEVINRNRIKKRYAGMALTDADMSKVREWYSSEYGLQSKMSSSTAGGNWTFSRLAEKYSSIDFHAGTDKFLRHSYGGFYERTMTPLVSKGATVLELGVASGHSLLLWRDYLENADVHGIDIQEEPVAIRGQEGITFHAVDCANKDALSAVFSGMEFDIVIDDASHLVEHQIASFEVLFPQVREGGVYIIEDVQSCNASLLTGLHESAEVVKGAACFDDDIVVFRKNSGLSLESRRNDESDRMVQEVVRKQEQRVSSVPRLRSIARVSECLCYRPAVDVIRYLPWNIRMVEVGVYIGETAELFLASGKVSEYFAVDMWVDSQQEAEFDRTLQALGPFAHKVKSSSLDALGEFADGSLDFVYIDADHSYEAVKSDIEGWLPKIKPGGMIGGHDHVEDNGVVKAVSEVFGKPDRLFPDSSWVARVGGRMKVAIAIPYHGDRSHWVMQTLRNVASDERVAEVVINDDGSEQELYDKLLAVVAPFGDKVRVSRNIDNIGMLKNKLKTVELCSSEWVVLLDSDNVIDVGYLAVLAALTPWCEDEVYIPEKSCIDFSALVGVISVDNFAERCCDGDATPVVGALLNNGNFLVNRELYLKCAMLTQDDQVFAVDSMNFCVRWLMGGGRLRVVEGLSYQHTTHSDSTWCLMRVDHADENDEVARSIWERLVEFCKSRKRLLCENPTVSVLIGAYNEETVISNAVRSVLEQEFKDFELLVGLNGCTDASASVLNRFNDPRLRVLWYPEKGRVLTLNKLLDEAKGEYVAVLDADDTWFPAKLRRQMEEIGDIDIIGTRILYFGKEGERDPKAIVATTHEEIRKGLRGGSNQIANSSCLIKRSLIERLGGWQEFSPLDDMDLWLRALQTGARFRNVPENLVRHYIGPDTAYNSIDSGPMKKRLMKEYRVMTKVGFLVAATGSYRKFIEPLTESIRTHFKEVEPTFFIFSDSDQLPNDVVRLKHRSSPWPYSTMMRYEMYSENMKAFEEMDYILALDADMRFESDVLVSEVFKVPVGMVAVKHPGFYNKSASEWPLERRSESEACCLHAKAYYCGGCVGGSTKEFLRMAAQVAEWTQKDIEKGIMPIWHDESYLNRWFAENPPSKVMSPEMCYPESWELPFKRKLVALDKNHKEERSVEGLSVMVVSKDRPFFLKALLDSFKGVCFDLTVLYLATNQEYAEEYRNVCRHAWWAKFIDQGAPGDMKPHFDRWLETASDIVMVCPEDNICIGSVDTDAIKKHMGTGTRFGFTLRLHPGIRNSQAKNHLFTLNVSEQDVLEYRPCLDNTSTWGYIWDMSSTFYRKSDMRQVVDTGPFRTINELESRGLGMFNPQQVDNMLCFKYAPVTNIFVDTFIEGSKWCLGQHVTSQQALELSRRGVVVDVEATFKERDRLETTHVKSLFLEGGVSVEKILAEDDTRRLGNKAIVVIPQRNSARFLEACLHSIVNQTYKDTGIIVVDDMSDDDSVDIAERCFEEWGFKNGIVVRNTERKYATRNIEDAITDLCSDEESVIFLIDGDDWLLEETAIEEMIKQHEKADVVWSQFRHSNGRPGMSGAIPASVPPRKYPWVSTHLRSFKKFLFDAIDRSEFIDEDGKYFRVTWDQCIMYPIIEMTPPDRRCFYNRVLYQYNLHELNDGHTTKGHEDQVRAENLIRGRPPASLHPRYTESDLEKGVTVVVSSYNQRDELEVFLESMYHQSVLPVEVVVTDDGSTDGTLEWLDGIREKYPFELMVVTRGHDGYRLASLNNAGAAKVSSGRILFTNADVLHNGDSVALHAALPETVVGAGMVRGIPRGGNVSKFLREQRLESMQTVGRNNLGFLGMDPAKDQAGVWGGNVSMPTQAFREAGGYDESYVGWGGEDADLVGRLVKAGCGVEWVEESVGYHMEHEFRDYHYESAGAKKYAAEKMSRACLDRIS